MVDPLPFRERLSWDAASGEIRDGDIRYLLIRPDALMAVFRDLPTHCRDEALSLFRMAIETYGARSAATYAAAATGRPLIEIVAATAPQLGWGVWSLKRRDGADFAVTVENSPFAAGFGPSAEAVCAPIAGMLGAVAGLVAGRPRRFVEHRCAAVTGRATCHFASEDQ